VVTRDDKIGQAAGPPSLRLGGWVNFWKSPTYIRPTRLARIGPTRLTCHYLKQNKKL